MDTSMEMAQMSWHMHSTEAAWLQQLLHKSFKGTKDCTMDQFDEMHPTDNTCLHFSDACGTNAVNSKTLPKIH